VTTGSPQEHNPQQVLQYVNLKIINLIYDYVVSIPHTMERKVNGAELLLKSRQLLISSRKSPILMQSKPQPTPFSQF
jgi:hypothetical protein